MMKLTNYVYDGYRVYSGPQPIMFRCWYRAYRDPYLGKESYCMPWEGDIIIGVSTHLVEYLKAHR